MNIPSIFWIVPAASVVALSFAWAFYRLMKREDEGTPRMREIAAHVRKGAMAYLRQQYKVVLVVFLVLALFFAYLAYGAGVQNPWVPFAFLTGGFFSGLAGFFGMKTATYASARTANAARQSLDRGLKVAFRSGAVMGLVVVGLGLLDISFWYVILNHFVEVAGPQKLVVITTTMLHRGATDGTPPAARHRHHRNGQNPTWARMFTTSPEMVDTVGHMTEYAQDIAHWFQVNAGKLIWLAVVLAVVFAADRVISRVLRRVLDSSQIPSASIFVNLTRVTIWVTGTAMVLQPVFGINPTTLVTALGVGGVAISLGLKDTIANVIGGFGLMLGRVIQPGDLVTIQGVTGTVHDITWRQTVVRTRSGDMMVIPNSVLNTAALTKLTPASEGMATLEFTAKASGDPSAISRDILDRVTKATADVTLEGQPPLVKFTGFSPYGMTGQVLVFAREGVLPSTVRDMAARAIAGSGTEYLVEDGGSSDNL